VRDDAHTIPCGLQTRSQGYMRLNVAARTKGDQRDTHGV
jgi:hypothetical protein